MSPRDTPDEIPGLFDLPLDPEPIEDDPVPEAPSSVDEQPGDQAIPPDPSSLFDIEPDEEPVTEEEPVGSRPTAGEAALAPAPLVPRLLAGLIDLGILLLVAVCVWIGLRILEVRINSATWQPMAIFLLSFSFLYFVFPLAFWGRTPGMGLMGLVARTPDDRPLTFGQTALRWLGTLGTAAGLGLPLLFTLFGDSFTDRVSGSRTLIRPVAKWG